MKTEKALSQLAGAFMIFLILVVGLYAGFGIYHFLTTNFLSMLNCHIFAPFMFILGILIGVIICVVDSYIKMNKAIEAEEDDFVIDKYDCTVYELDEDEEEEINNPILPPKE